MSFVNKNQYWPEAYGFSLYGKGPCYVTSVEKKGTAARSGILPGDQILELDDRNVAYMSLDALKKLARHSKNVPPTLRVVSKAQFVEISPSRKHGYGLKLKGSMPVLVESVDIGSPADAAGIRSSDIVLQVNNRTVRSADGAKSVLRSQLGRIGVVIIPVPKKSEMTKGPTPAEKLKVQKTKELFERMNAILEADVEKKTQILDCLRQYAVDHDMESFTSRLGALLSSRDQRRLIPDIRVFVPDKYKNQFDTLMDDQPIYQTADQGTSCSLDNHRRVVVVQRQKEGSFGFVLRGHSPVYVESIDSGSPADQAGLMPGDCIMKLNGLDVRKCSHRHLVMLLQGSGTNPTLEVEHGKHKGLVDLFKTCMPGMHRTDSDESVVSCPSSEWMHHVLLQNGETKDFKQQLHYLLTDKERACLRKELLHYNESRDVHHLVEALGPILDTPSKKTLWAYLFPVLEASHQSYVAERVPLPQEAATFEKPKFSTDIDSVPLPEAPWSDRQLPLGLEVASFKEKLLFLLNPTERALLKYILQNYDEKRDVFSLVEELPDILDTPSKQVLWFHILPLLSPPHREYVKAKVHLPDESITATVSHMLDAQQMQMMQEQEQDVDHWMSSPHEPPPNDFSFIGQAASIVNQHMNWSSSDEGSASSKNGVVSLIAVRKRKKKYGARPGNCVSRGTSPLPDSDDEIAQIQRANKLSSIAVQTSHVSDKHQFFLPPKPEPSRSQYSVRSIKAHNSDDASTSVGNRPFSDIFNQAYPKTLPSQHHQHKSTFTDFGRQHKGYNPPPYLPPPGYPRRPQSQLDYQSEGSGVDRYRSTSNPDLLREDQSDFKGYVKRSITPDSSAFLNKRSARGQDIQPMNYLIDNSDQETETDVEQPRTWASLPKNVHSMQRSVPFSSNAAQKSLPFLNPEQDSERHRYLTKVQQKLERNPYHRDEPARTNPHYEFRATSQQRNNPSYMDQQAFQIDDDFKYIDGEEFSQKNDANYAELVFFQENSYERNNLHSSTQGDNPRVTRKLDSQRNLLDNINREPVREYKIYQGKQHLRQSRLPYEQLKSHGINPHYDDEWHLRNGYDTYEQPDRDIDQQFALRNDVYPGAIPHEHYIKEHVPHSRHDFVQRNSDQGHGQKSFLINRADIGNKIGNHQPSLADSAAQFNSSGGQMKHREPYNVRTEVRLRKYDPRSQYRSPYDDWKYIQSASKPNVEEDLRSRPTPKPRSVFQPFDSSGVDQPAYIHEGYIRQAEIEQNVTSYSNNFMYQNHDSEHLQNRKNQNHLVGNANNVPSVNGQVNKRTGSAGHRPPYPPPPPPLPADTVPTSEIRAVKTGTQITPRIEQYEASVSKGNQQNPGRHADSFLSAGKKSQLLGILKPKKAYNISIILGSIRIPLTKVKSALYLMDEELLDPELLRRLVTYLPDSSELQQYSTLTSRDVSKLNQADQFMFEVVQVPDYESRIRAQVLKATFMEKVDEVRQQFINIKKGSLELKTSQKFAQILEVIMYIRKQLNLAQRPFQLEYLGRLDNIWTVNQTNLLQEVVQAVQTCYPECFSISSELRTIPKLAKVSSKELYSELGELRRLLQQISRILSNTSASNSGTVDKFHDVIGHFISEASDNLQSLFSLQASAIEAFNSMLNYFQEDAKKVTTEQIFGTVAEFLTKYERVCRSSAG